MCPLGAVVDSILRQWFFGYLNLNDIRAITIISVFQGPSCIARFVAALIVFIVETTCAIEAGKKEGDETVIKNLRGLLQFMHVARKISQSNESTLPKLANIFAIN
jgi:hypothetical protein